MAETKRCGLTHPNPPGWALTCPIYGLLEFVRWLALCISTHLALYITTHHRPAGDALSSIVTLEIHSSAGHPVLTEEALDQHMRAAASAPPADKLGHSYIWFIGIRTLCLTIISS